MLAAILYGLEQRWEAGRCLMSGVAAGAANAGVWEVATATRSAIDALVPQVLCMQIS